MRKLLWLFCGLGLVATLTQGFLLLEARPLLASDEASGAFLHFPLDTAQTINVAPISNVTERERIDQLRDWLLLSVLADAGLSPGALNAVTFDLPPVRDQALQAFGSLEYGYTRSRLLDNGQIIALIPAGLNASERYNGLSHIFDRHRKNSGTEPQEILPFEYRIARDAQAGTITRRAPVLGAELLTKEAGYYTALISDVAALEQFLSSVDDVTSVRMVDGKLELGGREILGYRSIGSEEIAALWQSEHDLLVNEAERSVNGSGFSLDWKYDYRGLQTVFDEIRPLLDASSAGKAFSFAMLHARFNALLQRDLQLAETLADLVEALDGYAAAEQFFVDAQARPVTYADLERVRANAGDYAELPWIDTLVGDEQTAALALEQLAAGDPQAQESLRQDQAAFERYLERYCQMDVAYTQAELDYVAESLIAEDIRPLTWLIDKLYTGDSAGDIFLRILFTRVQHQYTYQFARYDGSLAGTKAGMLLFYTDLLAKMWSFNYEGSTPEQAIPDFKSRVSIGPDLPVLHAEAMERLSYSRLWFEPDPDGYQVVGGSAPRLLFERDATRIVSLSSDPNLRREDNSSTSNDDPGADEESANPESAAFIGWWDKHFDEIASYEPEYQRLNQLMKWSIIIGWLNANSSGDALAFLGDVPVQRDLWFPDWVKRNRKLRFQSWDQVPFHERGYKGEQSETLALLVSDSYEQTGIMRYLRGGVSLASRRMLAQASEIADDMPLALRRSYLEYGAKNFSAEAMRSADGVTFAVADDLTANTARLTANVKPGTPLRGIFGEVAEAPFERTITSQASRVSFSARSGETAIGKLEVVSEGNGLRVGWHSLDEDAGQALANAMVSSSAPETTLLKSPNVQSVVRLNSDGAYMVKLKGADDWMKIVPDPNPGEQIASDYQLRIGTPGADGTTYNLAWINERNLGGSLSREGYIIYGAEDAVGTMPVGSISARSPPRSALPVELSQGSASVRGYFDPLSNELYLEAVGHETGSIAGRLRTYDMIAIRQQAAAGGPIRYSLADERVYQSALANDFAEGPAATARRLSSDPGGYALRMAEDLSDGLKAVDQLIAGGDDLNALASLQRLEQVHGPLAEIRLRQGLAEIGMGRTDQTATLVRSINETPLSSSEQFFAEIKQRIDLEGISPTQRSNYYQYTSYLSWRNSLLERRLAPEQLSLRSVNNQLQIELSLKSLPKYERWQLGDKLDNASIYVQDSPGLNNLDWAAAPDTAMHQVISGGLGDVVKLTGGDIADFNPAMIYVGSQRQVAFSLKTAPNWARIYIPGSAPSGLPQAECPPEQSDCQQPPTYIVIARP